MLTSTSNSAPSFGSAATPRSSGEAHLRLHVRSRKVTGVTVVGVRGHLVAVEASAEDAAILELLMSVGSHERLEFLG